MTPNEVTQRNKELAIAYWGRNLAKKWDVESQEFHDDFHKRYTEDYWNHASDPNETPDRGIENVKEVSLSFQELFEEPKFEITRVVAEDDLVVVEGLFTAIVVGGKLFGIPANRQRVSQPHVHTLRFRDGKVCEHFVVRDDYVMYAQMTRSQQAGGITHFRQESLADGSIGTANA